MFLDFRLGPTLSCLVADKILILKSANFQSQQQTHWSSQNEGGGDQGGFLEEGDIEGWGKVEMRDEEEVEEGRWRLTKGIYCCV